MQQTKAANKITEQEYSGFQYSYDYFNQHLFGGILPQCLMTLQRQANAKGYFHSEHFQGRGSNQKTDEIALNPDTFGGRTDEEILSTLAHEMCHLWNYHFGKRSRPGYHNKSWGKKMVEIGLKPISYDFPGSMVGQRVSHEIIPNGPFQKITQQLLASGFQLNWQSGYLFEPSISLGGLLGLAGLEIPPEKIGFILSKKKDRSKVKFSCPECKQNAWAKKTALLLCGHCRQEMLPQE